MKHLAVINVFIKLIAMGGMVLPFKYLIEYQRNISLRKRVTDAGDRHVIMWWIKENYAKWQ